LPPKELSVIELTLPTMTCGHCVRTVTDTVQKLDPVAKLNIDLPQHKVQIESSRPAEDFRAALAEEGYAPA
jgi:copper chaperone